MEKLEAANLGPGPDGFKQGTVGWIVDYAYEIGGPTSNPVSREILDKLKTGDVKWYQVNTSVASDLSPTAIAESLDDLPLFSWN